MYNKCVHCQKIYNLFVRSLETGRCQMYKTTAKMSEKSSNQRGSNNFQWYIFCHVCTYTVSFFPLLYVNRYHD